MRAAPLTHVQLVTLHGHSTAAVAIAFAPDNGEVAVAGESDECEQRGPGQPENLRPGQPGDVNRVQEQPGR